MDSYQDQFRALYGVDPTIRVEAPGRVNLIGEHIDYLDGYVVPAAIDRQIVLLAVEDRTSSEIEIWSEEQAQGHPPYKFTNNNLNRRNEPGETWLNYLIGVAAQYEDQGISTGGCKVAIFSTIPSGAGLSSSAALETAMALLIEEMAGQELGVTDRALLCQKAEHEWVGVPCGIMDQLSVGAGIEDHVLQIDCRDLTFETVPLPESICLIVADSGVKHSLGDGEYRARREDCEEALKKLGKHTWREVKIELVNERRDQLGSRLFRRARHAVTEMQRVIEFVTALRSSDLDGIARLMREGHDSLRHDYEVSCPELDFLVEAGYEFGSSRGQVGSRMTGGGFGGSTVHLVKEDSASEFLEHLLIEFRAQYGRELNCFVTRASQGARSAVLSAST